MATNKVLLSFDIEEFDLPREKGKGISLEEGVKVSSKGAEKILEILDKNQIKATFFTTGNFAKTNPTLVKKMQKAGHEIACHGVDHFYPDKSDPEKSKKIIEEVIGTKVYGYRQPRMFKISYPELKRQGFLYDSSVNPAFIPGRYNNSNIPRHTFTKSGITVIPASAATFLRIPMFWLALHLFPKHLYLALAKTVLKQQDYFTTYFHPWEFTDFGGFKAPWYIVKNSGEKLVQRLDWLIKKLKEDNNEFMTYSEYLKGNKMKATEQSKKQTTKPSFKESLKQLKSNIQNNSFLLKPFVASFIIYLLGASALLLNGVHYADDVARTSFGYPGWSAFSRYLNTILAHVLHADHYLTNIAPLPQIIAIALLATASVITVCLVSGKEIFKEKWTKWIWQIFAVIPLGLCPYFLECLSYQYDSPYMALSILFAVFPFIFRKKSRSLFLFVTVICMWGLCATYQASAGIFLVLMLFLAIKDWSESSKKSWQESLKFLSWSSAGFLLAMLIFSKLLMLPVDDYISNSTPELNNFFSEFIEHLKHYFDAILKDFKVLWQILIGLIGFCFVILFTIRSKRNKIAAILVSIIGLVAMLIAAYAPYSALEKPLYATRAMYAIGSVIAVASVYIVSSKGWQKIASVPVFALAWCFFVFALTYGNALKEQYEFHSMQEKMVISDLNEILPTLGDETKNLQIDGQIGYTPVIKSMPESTYHLVHRLIKSSYGRNIPWMAYRLTDGPYLPGTVYNRTLNLKEENLSVLKETVLYTIRGNEHNILIEFKGELMDVND